MLTLKAVLSSAIKIHNAEFKIVVLTVSVSSCHAGGRMLDHWGGIRTLAEPEAKFWADHALAI